MVLACAALSLVTLFPQSLESRWLLYLAYAPQGLYPLLPLPWLAIAVMRKRRNDSALALLAMILMLGPAGLKLTVRRFAPAQMVLLSLNADSWNTPPSALLSFCRDAQADVLFMQEMWTPQICEQCASKTPRLKWYRHPIQSDSAELAIATGLPVRRIVTLPGEVENSAMALEAELNGRPLILCTLHMRKSDDPQRNRPAPLEMDRCQRDQVRSLLNSLRASGLPLIIGGDRNCTPLAPAYRLLNEDLHDCFSAAGTGFGYSFPAFFPLWRIDGISLSDDLMTDSFTVLGPVGSDHRPIRAEISWR